MIASAIFAIAMLRYPSATASARARRRCARASASNAARTASASSGSSPPGPKIFGKQLWDQLAGHQIGVGDRRAARRGDRRAGPGSAPALVRPDAEARAVEVQDRAAAGRDGVDQHHRRAQAHARDLRLEGALVVAVEWATSVEVPPMSKPMTRPKPAAAAVSRHRHHAARRAGQHRVLAAERLRRPVRPPDDIMNISARAGALDVQLGGHLARVTRQDRREIGVDHRGVAAADQLDQGRDIRG